MIEVEVVNFTETGIEIVEEVELKIGDSYKLNPTVIPLLAS